MRQPVTLTAALACLLLSLAAAPSAGSLDVVEVPILLEVALHDNAAVEQSWNEMFRVELVRDLRRETGGVIARVSVSTDLVTTNDAAFLRSCALRLEAAADAIEAASGGGGGGLE